MTDQKAELVILDYWNIPAMNEEELYSSVLVTQNYGKDIFERTEKYIMDFYAKLWGIKGRTPQLSEVFDAAFAYNYEIYEQLAAIEISREYDLSTLDADKLSELIQERAEDYSEMYAQYDNANLDYFSAWVLNKNRCIYETETEDIVYDESCADDMVSLMEAINKDVKVYVNDCQNIMFGAFIEDGFTANGGDLTYIVPDKKALVAG